MAFFNNLGCALRPRGHRLALSAWAIAAGFLAAPVGDAGAQTSIRPVLAEQTPLILKDGRIANVSVHVIPFDKLSDRLAAPVARDFAGKIDELATDCFLTAQAIGHVQPGDTEEGDTLTAHRLARARSDQILNLLTESGIPQSSIASVWDWQFLIPEPRVTLWVFELRRGEDCTGTRLDPTNVVASLDDSTGLSELGSPKRLRSEPEPLAADAAIEPEPEDEPVDLAKAAPVEEAPVEQVPARIAATEIDVPQATIAEVKPIDRTVEAITEPTSSVPQPLDFSALQTEQPAAVEPVAAVAEPAPAPEPSPAPVETAAAVDEALAVEAAAPPAPKPEIAAVEQAPSQGIDEVGGTGEGDQTLVITFAVNSSYLPRGASKEIRDMLKALDDGQYQAELVASVGSGDVSGASAEEALRYNRWMAERRIGRVQEQFDKVASAQNLKIDQSFLENDGSRQVVIRLRPLP